LVKNEARFIWFSVMSVIKYVDRVLIWDTGSTDETLEIIDKIGNHPLARNKFFVEKLKIKNFDEEYVRQKMLDATEESWFIVVDADEIWWNQSILDVTEFIRNSGVNYESIVVPTINLVGDIYHFQDSSAGRYHLAGRVGHYNLRAVNRHLPGLKSLGEHGVWGWADGENRMIQERSPEKIKYIDASYLHATHLQRAGNRNADFKVLKRSFKLKHELGLSFPRDYFYPESFFLPRPGIVQNPWAPMNLSFKFRAFFETPLRHLKRRVLPSKIGY
jgi:glycosyltransferase involved in cell wall biosynthesis